MNVFLLLFLIYIAFSIVATGFYLYYVGFNKDDLFVLKMERVEQKEFLIKFMLLFGVVLNILVLNL